MIHNGGFNDNNNEIIKYLHHIGIPITSNTINAAIDNIKYLNILPDMVMFLLSIGIIFSDASIAKFKYLRDKEMTKI